MLFVCLFLSFFLSLSISSSDFLLILWDRDWIVCMRGVSVFGSGLVTWAGLGWNLVSFALLCFVFCICFLWSLRLLLFSD